jgi:hypothetical protein
MPQRNATPCERRVCGRRVGASIRRLRGHSKINSDARWANANSQVNSPNRIDVAKNSDFVFIAPFVAIASERDEFAADGKGLVNRF